MSRIRRLLSPLLPPADQGRPVFVHSGFNEGQGVFPMSIALLTSCSFIFSNCAPILPLFIDDRKLTERLSVVSGFHQTQKLSRHMQDTLLRYNDRESKGSIPKTFVSFALIQEHPHANHVTHQALDRLSQSSFVRQVICSVRMSPISSQQMSLRVWCRVKPHFS